LTPTECEQSLIVEFQLSLEGQAACWYAKQDINTFMTFQELMDKFEELFVKIDPTKVLRESMAKFLLQFRAVQGLMDTAPSEDMQKRQFVKPLKEPLWSSFALLDFSMLTLIEVFNRALNLDHQQLGLELS
jgi:hypothetical protein